jgi:uncharacterized protein
VKRLGSWRIRVIDVDASRCVFFILAAFFLLLTTVNVHAASFDCGKAASEVEKLICGDDELSKLDDVLNVSYLAALERSDSDERMIKSQKQWLRNERNACRNAECLKKAYETQIKELASSFRGDEYVLVMSKDDCVCQHMLKIYNKDLNKYGEIRYDQHEEFKAIKWEKQKSYFEPGESRKEDDILISKFDINNDGSPEIIIKDEHRTLNSMDSDAIYIFSEKDFADFKDKIVINEGFAKKAIGIWGWAVLDKKPFQGNVYSLHDLPAVEVWTTPAGKQIKNYYGLGGWFYFYPFFYKGKYFTSMHDWLPDVGKWWDTEYEYSVKEKWEVILQFTPENQLKDICYLLKIPNCKNKSKNRN